MQTKYNIGDVVTVRGTVKYINVLPAEAVNANDQVIYTISTTGGKIGEHMVSVYEHFVKGGSDD